MGGNRRFEGTVTQEVPASVHGEEGNRRRTRARRPREEIGFGVVVGAGGGDGGAMLIPEEPYTGRKEGGGGNGRRRRRRRWPLRNRPAAS